VLFQLGNGQRIDRYTIGPHFMQTVIAERNAKPISTQRTDPRPE